MRKAVGERIGIAAVAALVAFSASAYASRGSKDGSGFIDIHAGQTARFDHTTVVCTNPKGQISGGQVACEVDYVRWRNLYHPVRMKYGVSLTLRDCVEVNKWSRLGGPRPLKEAKVC
jgi:hypothetical protein